MKKVGMVSVGSLENKLPLILGPLLLSSDVALSFSKNYSYPQHLSTELVEEINRLLQKRDVRNVVFDLRIHHWTIKPQLRRSRLLSQTLLDICTDLGINTSIILSNGNLLIGNAVGGISEKQEVRDILKGEGPPDITKFSLEIGADLLMMTKNTDKRIEAKKWLRDKILGGELSSSFSDHSEKGKFLALEEGYVHHHVLDELHALKSELAKIHPEICFFIKKKTGDWIEKGEDLIEFSFPIGKKEPLDLQTCQKIFVISDDPPEHQPLILARMGFNHHN